MVLLPAFTYTPPASPTSKTGPLSIIPRPRFTRSKTADNDTFGGKLTQTLKLRAIKRCESSSHTSVGVMTQPPSPAPTSSAPPSPTLRQERKAAEMEAQRVQAEEELKANGGKPDEAERERVAITDLCKALNVEMHEITPDGHCLYAAVADQLNLLGRSHKLNYLDMRKGAAEYMRSHADDFMPFISDSDEHMAGIENKEAGTQDANVSQQQRYFLDYCDAVEKTAVWGGQPEILALSRAFHTPIHVLQAGCPIVKVGTEEARSGEQPLVISYHRHMYGLGEHYNSLHRLDASKKTVATAA